MPNTFFTSDLHFRHANVLGFCKRPHDTVEEMNEYIIQQWNSQVKPGDTVWEMGDFVFSAGRSDYIKYLYKRLNGNIGHVLGNHNKEKDFEGLKELYGGRCLFVGHYKEISLNKKRICMSHFPMIDHHNCKYGSWMAHGHLHSGYQVAGKVLDVGWDSAFEKLGEYRLWTFEDIDNFMKDRDIIYYGHHREEM